MNYCCDWCGESFDSHIDGVIKMVENAPIEHYLEDEHYNFCSYKCLRKWLAL